MPTLHDVIWKRDLIPYLHVKLLDVDITDDLLSEEKQDIEGIVHIVGRAERKQHPYVSI